MSLRPKRSHSAAVLVVLVVLLAGCSGLFGPGADSPNTETPPETEPTTSPTDSTATTDTTSPTDSTETTDDGERTMSGSMLAVIEGKDTHFDGAADENASFWINESQNHTWHAANDSMSMAEALKQIGVNASAESLTYNGTTYRDGKNNTTVAYRVDGTPVEDPSEYQIKDGDELSVYVGTGNQETPGRKYTEEHPHPHGTLEVTVEGEEVMFTDKKYVKADEYFHFHGNQNGEQWHAHSVNLTVAYALSTFPNMQLTNKSFKYDGKLYRAGKFGTTINVTVNGESVDPESYILKDGDDIQVEVTR